jgi:hypothetical protein
VAFGAQNVVGPIVGRFSDLVDGLCAGHNARKFTGTRYGLSVTCDSAVADASIPRADVPSLDFCSRCPGVVVKSAASDLPLGSVGK